MPATYERIAQLIEEPLLDPAVRGVRSAFLEKMLNNQHWEPAPYDPEQDDHKRRELPPFNDERRKSAQQRDQ